MGRMTRVVSRSLRRMDTGRGKDMCKSAGEGGKQHEDTAARDRKGRQKRAGRTR